MICQKDVDIRSSLTWKIVAETEIWFSKLCLNETLQSKHALDNSPLIKKSRLVSLC